MVVTPEPYRLCRTALEGVGISGCLGRIHLGQPLIFLQWGDGGGPVIWNVVRGRFRQTPIRSRSLGQGFRDRGRVCRNRGGSVRDGSYLGCICPIVAGGGCVAGRNAAFRCGRLSGDGTVLRVTLRCLPLGVRRAFSGPAAPT